MTTFKVYPINNLRDETLFDNNINDVFHSVGFVELIRLNFDELEKCNNKARFCEYIEALDLYFTESVYVNKKFRRNK